jgi:hypothetical protein
MELRLIAPDVARLARMVPVTSSGPPDRDADLPGSREETDDGPASFDDPGAASFDAFVAAGGSALLSYAHLLTGQCAAAEDLVQTALVRTLSSWGRVRNKGNPEGYVRRTMARLQINTWRGRARHREVLVPVPTDTGPDGAAVDPSPGRLDERDAMWAALGTPETFAEVPGVEQVQLSRGSALQEQGGEAVVWVTDDGRTLCVDADTGAVLGRIDGEPFVIVSDRGRAFGIFVTRGVTGIDRELSGIVLPPGCPG